MDYYLLIFPPLIGAFVGFITNVVAVELLFHPKKPINIFGIRIQGLVPARSKEIIERFMDSLSDILNEGDFEFIINRAIERAYDEKLKSKISFSVLNFKIDEWVSKTILPWVKDFLTKSISENVDVREFVLRKAEEISDEEIEILFKKFAKKELRFIELSGLVLGFVIGIIQSIFFYFAG
ncbi:hypothetical protein Asulf_01836 [Archaeoglobus sulfaticallidus PM70-1]|uniref:DUF445 domain-containing protein n=1 Tax=Archaeoglobus sulfaticallidus PM70-1 TaxID=387631 RepID=N0BME8_9EURY|nr:hypothetical protein [Archaeoglobus sulfaticallidus]AGK61806.1 hypothetical protein Asulf_01836 [Archaeoglobus sulfaticallidus PM70-1]